jgi:hypothetical protein
MADRRDVPYRSSRVVVNEEAARRFVTGDAHTRRPDECARPTLRRARVVISRGVHHRDAVIAEPLRLFEQESLRLERESVAVEEVASDQERMYIFANGQVDGVSERLTGSGAQAAAYRLGSTSERGVEVDIGHVQESHGAN